MTRSDLEAFFQQVLGEKAYRGRQAFHWMHSRHAWDPEAWTDFPSALRGRVKQAARIPVARRVSSARSADGTEKSLIVTEDGRAVETARMVYRYGSTVCVSSQAGCRMGCRFCATAASGYQGSLAACEMADQVYLSGPRPSHVVVMGCGEPLDNYDATVAFLRIMNDPLGLGISARSMTVSTCGLVPGIERLSREGLPVTLAVSLHAPDDETRARLMPVARAFSLMELLGACARYFAATGRRVTLEYSLMKGVNDTPAHAGRLVELLVSGSLPREGAHVNLIRLNPVAGSGFDPAGPVEVERFARALRARGITTTVRRRLGADIDAACGQLRSARRGPHGHGSGRARDPREVTSS